MIMILLMVIFGVAAVVLMIRTRQGHAGAKPAAVMCALLVLILVGVRVFVPGIRANPALKGIERYEEICGTYLGQHLAERYPGVNVLVVVPPSWGGSEKVFVPQRILVEPLRMALEQGGATVTLKELPIPQGVIRRAGEMAEEMGDPALTEQMIDTMTMDYPIWFGVRNLRQLLTDAAGEADLVVCTVELGMPIQSQALPPKGSAPDLVLINSWIDDTERALQNTVLDTLVQLSSGSRPWEPGDAIPGDLEEAFNTRYVLRTKDSPPDS